MIYRGALVRAVKLVVRFSYRPIRLVRRIARRALHWMRNCDARASFVVANLAPQNRDKQRLASRELIVSRVLCRRTQRHRQGRLFVPRLVRRRRRIEESNGARRVASSGRELRPDPSHGMKPHNQIPHA